MGQQQLLLVILVTIIVGIATVVAINTFGSAAQQANVDAVRQDVIQIAASAQQYYMRPAMLGGGGRSFAGITFADFAFAASAADGLVAQNENGRYVISADVQNSFQITAHPASDPAYVPADVADDGSISGGTDATTNGPLCGTVQPDDLVWISPTPGANTCP